MSYGGVFRGCVAVSFLSYVAWFFFPYTRRLVDDQNVMNVLTYSGYGAEISFPLSVGWAVFSAWGLASLGLLLYVNAARYLFLVLVLLDLGFTTVGGLVVSTPGESFLIMVKTILDGAILVFAFLHPVARRFAGRPA